MVALLSALSRRIKFKYGIAPLLPCPDTLLKGDATETPALLSFSFLVMQILLFVVLIPFPSNHNLVSSVFPPLPQQPITFLLTRDLIK